MQAPPRLNAWLFLANMARDTRSDIESLRDYYMVLEDVYSGRNEPAAVRNVRYARNFVGHREPLTMMKKFLLRELGHPVVQFDPHNADHLRLASRWREEARRLVDAELARHF